MKTVYVDAHRRRGFFYAAVLHDGYRYGFEDSSRYPKCFNKELFSSLCKGRQVVCFDGVAEMLGLRGATEVGPQPDIPARVPSVEHLCWYVKNRNLDMLINPRDQSLTTWMVAA